jgi:hypothetical protein
MLLFPATPHQHNTFLLLLLLLLLLQCPLKEEAEPALALLSWQPQATCWS